MKVIKISQQQSLGLGTIPFPCQPSLVYLCSRVSSGWGTGPSMLPTGGFQLAEQEGGWRREQGRVPALQVYRGPGRA